MEMFLYKIIILFTLFTSVVKSDKTNINCPRFCTCDSYLQLNRAQCSSKKLISAELDLSNAVQILDLSYNDITLVDNKCFAIFFHIKYLNLSHNALHALDWDAFNKLRHLSEIDLSYNRLEYLDERLFAKNKYLTKINLEGNKLESLENKPLLRNPFVFELSLRNSQINLLQPRLFKDLTNLKRLDLSKNLLNNFNIEDFQDLTNLRELNLEGNFIKCDDIIKKKLKQLEKRGVNIAMRSCSSEKYAQVNEKTKMFEKIIMSTQEANEENHLQIMSGISQWRLNLDLEELSSEEFYDKQLDYKEKEIIDSSKNTPEWLQLATDSVLCNKQHYLLCQEYRSCLQELNKEWPEKPRYKEEYTENDIKFAFIMGMAVGISAIVIIIACALCLKSCFESKKTDVALNSNTDDFSNQPLARPASQIPLQVRRQSRRRVSHPRRSLVRYEGPVAENFLSRLFGRPARRQYYRTLNQNTATLIRRLSQSNIFNNRLSQHFIDRQIDGNRPELQVLSLPQPLAPRPETPPPSYGDAVIKNESKAK